VKHRSRRGSFTVITVTFTLTLAAAAAGDARAEAPPKVTFSNAVQRALARNPSAVVAAEEIKRSEALAREARASWLPTLTGNATYTRLDSDRVLSGRVIQGADSFNANLQLVVPILQPRGWVASARAKDAAEIAKLDAADVKKEVALATGHAFLTVIAQRRILETTERARDNAKAHEDFTQQRFSGGIGNRLDLVRASQERATSEAQVHQQVIALARAEEALGVLLGEEGPVDAAGDAELAAPPTLAAALGEVETRRTDIVAQKERVETARKAVRDDYVDFLPALSAIGQPFYQNPSTLTLPTTGWQAQLVLTLPLYDGGARYGLHDERDAVHAEAKTELEGALRQARSEVRIAFEAVLHADEALGKARDAAKLADEAMKLTQVAYTAGATSNLEVVDAERRARDADAAAAVAEDASRQARLDLLAASGRFP
jgi:outer membrane protein TolC